MSPVVELTQVSVRFGWRDHAVQALQEVSIAVAAGERVALVGANGSGKSTLLRVLHGLAAPSAGRVQRDVSLRHAMLFQRPYLLRLSVQANVALGLWLRGVPWRTAQQEALLALEQVGLADLARRNASQLSGGQQQRVALARAWALRPAVLLLDEPTASLDPHAKREVEALINAFAPLHSPMTLVFASHNLGQVKRLASRVVYLEQGRILADLPVREFFSTALLQARYPEAHLFVKGELV